MSVTSLPQASLLPNRNLRGVGGHTNPDHEPFRPYGQRLAASLRSARHLWACSLVSRAQGQGGVAGKLTGSGQQKGTGQSPSGELHPHFPSLGGWGATLRIGQDTFLALHLGLTPGRLGGLIGCQGPNPGGLRRANSSRFLRPQPQAPPSTQRFSQVPTGKPRASLQDVTLGSLPG